MPDDLIKTDSGVYWQLPPDDKPWPIYTEPPPRRIRKPPPLPRCPTRVDAIRAAQQWLMHEPRIDGVRLYARRAGWKQDKRLIEIVHEKDGEVFIMVTLLIGADLIPHILKDRRRLRKSGPTPNLQKLRRTPMT